MTDAPQPTSGKVLMPVLSVLLILVAAIAGWSLYSGQQKQAALDEQVSTLTSQLEDSEKQIAQLQPLAQKARELPVVLRINRHALTPGYTLITINQSRSSLRFTFTVNGGRTFNRVIDAGRLWLLNGLASGDRLTIESDGFDPKEVTIQ
jgi:hypothetical protein